MAVKPRWVAYPPKRKPRFPFQVDWSHPLLHQCVGFTPFIPGTSYPAGNIASRHVSFPGVSHYSYSILGIYETTLDPNSGYWGADGFVTFYRALYNAFNPSIKPEKPTAGELCVSVVATFLEPAPYGGYDETPYFATAGYNSGFHCWHHNGNNLYVYRGSRAASFTYPVPQSNETRTITVWSKPNPSTNNFIRVYINGELVFDGVTDGYHYNSVTVSNYKVFAFGCRSDTHTNRHPKTLWRAAYVHTRDIGLDGHRAIYNDPYAPIRRRRVLVPVAATGPTPADLTGSVQAQNSTATGALTVEYGISGSVQAQPSTATGSLAVEHNLTGAVQAQPSTTAGALTVEHNLTGTVQAQTASTSGVLDVAGVETVTGSVQAPPSTATGALTVEHDLTGAVQAQPSAATGALTVEHNLAGAVQAQPSQSTGSMTTSLAAASGAVQAQPSTTAGTLTVERLLSGAVQAQPSTAAGSLSIERLLSGAVQAQPSRASGYIDAGAPEIIPAGKPGRRRKWYRVRLSDGSVVVSSQRVAVERRVTQEIVARSRPTVAANRERLRPTEPERREIQRALQQVETVEYQRSVELDRVIEDLKRELRRPPVPSRKPGPEPETERWWLDPEKRARITLLLLTA